MKFVNLAGLFILTPVFVGAAIAQTETLYTIDRPAGVLHDWTSTMEPLPDLNGDGVRDLALAGRNHGSGTVRVFSGADGDSLFEITTGFHVLFFGRGIAGISDQTGDGIPEVVVVGFQSGDASSPEGRIHVYSGADGSVVRELTAPSGVSLREGRILALDDADGDGFEDILIRTVPQASLNSPRLQLFSSVTGEPLFAGFTDPQGFYPLQDPIRISDHDGDGHEDFMLGVSLQLQTQAVVQIRSSQTGIVLDTLTAPGFSSITGNGEGLVRLRDRDADGLDDFAIGSIFTGFIGVYSSADAGLLREWTCPDSGCIGSQLLNVGDIDGDGDEDLISVEADLFGNTDTDLVGLDIETGGTIFSQPIPGLSPGYGLVDSFVNLAGVDPAGFPTFAFFEFENDRVSVRRAVFDVGTNYCNGLPNSTGVGASIIASGSRSIVRNDLRLLALDLPVQQPGLFYYGGGQLALAFGDGLRCVGSGGSGVYRLAVTTSDASGLISYLVDNTNPPSRAGALTAGATWNFQGWYRDPAAGGAGFNLSDGLTLTFTP